MLAIRNPGMVLLTVDDSVSQDCVAAVMSRHLYLVAFTTIVQVQTV